MYREKVGIVLFLWHSTDSRIVKGTKAMRTLATTLLFVLLTAGTAAANPMQKCTKGYGSEVVEGCTALIDSRKFNGAQLSDLFNNRGVGYSQNGDREKALDDFSTAQKINVRNARAFRNAALELTYLERFDEAIEKISVAIKLEPSSMLNYGVRAEIYERANNLEEAIKSHTEVISREKNVATHYHARATIYAKLSRFEEALEDYTRAVQLNPRNPSYYFARGLAWSDAGKCDQAIPDYSKAIELSPKFANAYNNRGVCFGRMGKRDEAIADYQSALKHEPNHPKARHNLAGIQASPVIMPAQPLPPLPDFKGMLKTPETPIPMIKIDPKIFDIQTSVEGEKK